MPEKNKHKENTQHKNTITNGVVITTYVESLRTRSSKLLSEDPNRKTMPSPLFKVPHDAGTQGYDRRAQLLAYSRQLRNERSQKVDQVHQLSRNQSQPRSKKRLWLAQPVGTCTPSAQMPSRSSNLFRRQREESKGSKEVKRSKKRKGGGNNCYPFLRKLKNMLKKLSCKKW